MTYGEILLGTITYSCRRPYSFIFLLLKFIIGGQFNCSILGHKLITFILKTVTAAFMWYTSS